MKPSRRTLLPLGGLLAGLPLPGCVSPHAAERGAPAPAPELRVLAVRAVRTPTTVALQGIVVPEQAATLTALVAGKVTVLPEEGQRLAAGQAAVVLEPLGAQNPERAARAALEAAEGKAASTRTAARQAEVDGEHQVAGLEQALKAAEQAVARQRALLDDARLQATVEPERARARLAAAEAQLRQTEAGERVQRKQQLEKAVEIAQRELELAQRQFKRVKALYQVGLSSEADVDVAVLQLRRQRVNLQQTEKELELAQRGDPEDVEKARQEVRVATESVRGAEGLERQVAQRQADLAAAEAEVEKVRRSLEAARANRPLALTRAKDDARAAEAEVRRARAELNEAGERIRRATLKAPFAGLVTRRHTRAAQTVAEGAPLLDLVNTERLRFEASVPEADLHRIRTGDRVMVTVTGAAGPPLRGRVAEVVPATDPVKQSYKVRIDLDAPRDLKPGMMGTARVTLLPSETLPYVPFSALRRHFPREGAAEVSVVEGERLATRRVRLGEERAAAGGGERLVAVTDGLRDGDRVLLSDPRGLPPAGPWRLREINVGPGESASAGGRGKGGGG